MNCKKTWLGYVNYILATIILSAAIVAVIDFNIVFDVASFINNPENGLTYAVQPIPEIAAMFIGAGSLCVFALVFYGIRKLREKINKDNGVFDTDNISNTVGSVLSFIIFGAGITLRVLKIIDSLGKRVTSSVDLEGIENSFNNNFKFSITSFKNAYDSLICILYKFLGVKTDTYMWVNLVLQLLVILLLYSAVRNIFNSFVAVLPLVYYCLSPSLIRSVVNGGYENFIIIVCLLGLTIFTAIISLFKDNKNYHLIALLGSLLLESVFVLLIPLIYKNELLSKPVLTFEISRKLANIFAPFNCDFICLVMLILMFYGSISFFFSKRDNISFIFPIWFIALVFYLFSKNEWPGETLMFILFWTFAGLGLDELLISQVSAEYVIEESEISKETRELYIAKPVLEEININNEDISEANTIEEINESVDTPEMEEVSESVESFETEEISEPVENSETEEVSEPVESSEAEEVSESDLNDESCEISEDIDSSEGNDIPDVFENSENVDEDEIFIEPAEVAETSEEDNNITASVQLLVNPLPLPKKHEKKELAFSYEPSAAEMEFDIEISDNDDFDI